MIQCLKQGDVKTEDHAEAPLAAHKYQGMLPRSHDTLVIKKKARTEQAGRSN